MLGTPPQPCSSRGAMEFLGPYLPGAAIPQESICFGPTVQRQRALMLLQLPGAHTSVAGVTTWCRRRQRGERHGGCPTCRDHTPIAPAEGDAKA